MPVIPIFSGAVFAETDLWMDRHAEPIALERVINTPPRRIGATTA